MEENNIFVRGVRGEGLLRYQDKEYIATIKGVDDKFKTITSLGMLINGVYGHLRSPKYSRSWSGCSLLFIDECRQYF